MNSAERKAARRQRREAAREEKRAAFAEKYDSYERVISANSLIRAAKLSRRGVRWKASVQKYFMSLLRNIWSTRTKLQKGISCVMGFICFDLRERGKLRHIRSVHFKERVVQRSLSDNALVPMLSRSLIYDNGASMKGKGIHFALDRCKRQLQEYYRRNGSNKGWVLQIDFTGYFDNILHAPIKDMIVSTFHDRRLRWLIWQFVKSFGSKSLGIGSQVSQILAVAYPNRVDHYAREVLRLGSGARYMDDSYYFHSDKAYLEYCLAKLKEQFDSLGIILNPKKTQIIPIRSFTFLKVRFLLTSTGKVVMKPCAANIARHRRKLKAYKKKVDAGEMTLADVRASHESQRGYLMHLDAHDSIRELDKLFFDLFGVWPTRKSDKKKKKKKKKKG